MAYFKIGEHDYSALVSSLKVTKANKYSSQTNAAGDTVIDYISSKRTIEAGFISMDEATLAPLLADIDSVSVNISFRNPRTKALESALCAVNDDAIEYYTIQPAKVMCKSFTLVFAEL